MKVTREQLRIVILKLEKKLAEQATQTDMAIQHLNHKIEPLELKITHLEGNK